MGDEHVDAIVWADQRCGLCKEPWKDCMCGARAVWLAVTKAHARIEVLEEAAEREARIWREAAELVGGDIRAEALAALKTDDLFMAGKGVDGG